MNSEQSVADPPAALLMDPAELKRRIKSSEDLIMLPAAASEALALANDPDCSIPKIVGVIETDTGLVADILAMSNSAVYGARSEINSVQQAVVTIGTTQCQNLIVSSCLKALSNKLPKTVEWSRDVLWEHNTQTAQIARWVNKSLKLGFQGEEVSGAMIHDVGRILIAAAAPDVFDTVDRLSFCEDANTIQNERDLLGTDHCAVGADFAEYGGLPTPLVDVVRFHHSPLEAEDNSVLVCLIATADHMANYLMFNGGPEGYDMSTNPSFETLIKASSADVDVDLLVAEAHGAAAEKSASNS